MRLWLAMVLLVMVLTPVGRAQDLTVSAAVSLREALNDVAKLDEPAVAHLQLNFGATGHLLAQIRQGAPVDVFIAASDEQMNQAAAESLIVPSSRTVIATNSLVLIVPADSNLNLKSFDGLLNRDVKRLALGEPKAVPAGEYAMQVLRHLKLDEPLKPRMVFGESVRQVLDYAERGEVDAGIVYSTDAKLSGAKVRVIATADASWHRPICYPAAVVAGSTHVRAAEGFIRFLCDAKPQAVLRARGFAAPTTQPTARAGG